MGNISYTAHVSNKKSAITSKSKLAAVAKHNLRKYKSSDYSKDNICIIYGTSNLIDDVKTVYHKEFDEALEEYNKKQIRPDRKIEDYFEHVAGKEQDMAVEIIIQIGDREFWKQFDDMKSYMKLSYQIILDELRKRLPQFVVANAVVHLDEDSPHMHIVGVPVADGYKKGLSKQVSKRKVFTKDVLSRVLQDELREVANKEVNDWFGKQIKEKSKVDVDNAITLYEHLCCLPKHVLGDERFWMWLILEKCYAATIQAMPMESGKKIIADHWLFGQGRRRGLMFGALSRAYYRVQLTKDDTLEDAYELTKFATQNYMRYREFTWRGYSNNKTIVTGALKGEKKAIAKYGDTIETIKDYYPSIAKHISQLGSVMLLDFMREDYILDSVLAFCDSLAEANNIMPIK